MSEQQDRTASAEEVGDLGMAMMKLFITPIAVMMGAGACPCILVAKQEGGNFVLMPMDGSDQAAIIETLKQAICAMETGVEVKTMADLPPAAPGADPDCKCPNCSFRRQTGRLLAARKKYDVVTSSRPVLSPGKPGVH